MQVEYFIILIGAYLAGSVSFAYLVCRLFGGIDIRKHGSGNAGARNAARCLGVKFGFLAGLLDVVKGALPMALLVGAGYGGAITLVAGCMLVAGHNWPAFFGFKGGNGLAVSVGIMLSLAFWVTFAVSVIILFLGWLSTKIKPVREFAAPVDVEAICGYIMLPAALLFTGHREWVVIMPLLLGIMMLPTRISHIKKTENEQENSIPARNTE